MLEARDMPSLFGNAWPNAQYLTLSFAPDTTVISGTGQAAFNQAQVSGLFNEMAGTGSPAAWQQEILRAFQTWAQAANINIGLVPDGGSPFGPHSYTAGNAPVGKIRIGAFNTAPDVIALNQPYNILSGAWAGTLLFNRAHNFSIGGNSSTYDIFSTTLNEVGNLLGLADQLDPASALHGHYVGIRTGLLDSDRAALQGLYGGARGADLFEGGMGNETLATATRLNPYASPTDATKFLVSATGDLTTMADVDHYVFATRSDTTSLTIRLNTAGYSLLNARVTVYDALGNEVATATSAGAVAMQDIVITLSNVTPDSDYVVRVERAADDVFGIGGYALAVGYGFNSGGFVAPATTGGTTGAPNDTMATATAMAPVEGSQNTKFLNAEGISSATEVDWFKVTSPANSTNAMTVILRPDNLYELYAKATVYDGNGFEVAATVLANGEDGRYVIEVANPVAGAEYFVKVEAVGRNGTGLVGNYTIRVEFARPAVAMQNVWNGTLTDAARRDFVTFTIAEPKVVHFTLSATTTNPAVVSGLVMVVYNDSGTAVARLVAHAGTTTTAQFFLNAGTYHIKFEAATLNGEPLPDLIFNLRMVTVSDPIDPFAPLDPTLPPPPTPTTPPMTTEYIVLDQGDQFYISLGLIDLLGNPWVP
jgi:hypothetical protein